MTFALAALLIAPALVFFNDPRAQAAAGTYIKNREALDALRRISRERGPVGVFGM